jgi:hypothetical protein
MDWNEIDEEPRRRGLFRTWLVKAWDWASDTSRPVTADAIAELLSHVDEPDYPLWHVASQHGLIGEGKLAGKLLAACGFPPRGPKAVGFEKEVNYSPIIYLEEEEWRRIHGALGWVNRNTDTQLRARNFWLVSGAGNVVRFVVRVHGEEGD